MTTKVELKGEWASYWGQHEIVIKPAETETIRVSNDVMLAVSCNADNKGGKLSVQDFSLEIRRADISLPSGMGFEIGNSPFGTAWVEFGGRSSVAVRLKEKVMATVTHVPVEPAGRK